MNVPADPRRYVAFRAFGASRLLLETQSCVEDAEGSVAAGQYEAAAIQGRLTVHLCLSIRGLAREGELEFSIDDTAFDPFHGADPDEVIEGLVLASEGADLDATTAASWLVRLRRFFDETERRLGYDGRLPVLRSPEGMFAGLRVARDWTPLVEALGLPPLLPDDWIQEAPAPD